MIISSGLRAMFWKALFSQINSPLILQKNISHPFLSSDFQYLLFFFTISFLIFLEHLEREILHVPTANLSMSIHHLMFPPTEMDNLFPVPNSKPAPPLESWIPFPLTLLKNFYLPMTARTHIISKIQRRARKAKQRKKKEQNEVEERTSRWLGEKLVRNLLRIQVICIFLLLLHF